MVSSPCPKGMSLPAWLVDRARRGAGCFRDTNGLPPALIGTTRPAGPKRRMGKTRKIDRSGRFKVRQTGRNLLEPDVEHTQGQVFNRVPADPVPPSSRTWRTSNRRRSPSGAGKNPGNRGTGRAHGFDKLGGCLDINLAGSRLCDRDGPDLCNPPGSAPGRTRAGWRTGRRERGPSE